LNSTSLLNCSELLTVFSIADKAISDVIAPVHELLTLLVVNSIDACQGLLKTNSDVSLGLAQDNRF